MAPGWWRVAPCAQEGPHIGGGWQDSGRKDTTGDRTPTAASGFGGGGGAQARRQAAKPRCTQPRSH